MDKFVEGFNKLLRNCLFFFLGIFLIAPLVGTLTALIGLKWNFLPGAVVIILSLLCAFFMAKTTLFTINGVRDLLTYAIIFVISGFIYMSYSPALELRQDPSVYMLKAMNLCNYGTTYSDMDIYEEMVADNVVEELDEYAGIENGTHYKNGRLYTDFYPGGVYFYAMIGLLSKRMMFYGQTIIMMMNALLLYELLGRLTKKKSNLANVVYTIAFMIAPLIVWFGRGSFSEPSAMLYVLLLAMFFMDKEKVPMGLFPLTIVSLYSARIDYVLVMIVAVFALNYISTKWAVITTALGSIGILCYSKVYWIYYDRIIKYDMKILKYSVPLLIAGLLISMAVKRFWKELPKFYRSYFMTVLFVAAGIILALLAFRDNVTTNYQMAVIHEKYMRTYTEDVMDMLFMVFPSIFIVGGLLGLFKIQRNEDIDFVPGVFLLGITVVYSYFFISFGNSPQMYWGLRRYYNILLPVLFISFVLLTNEIESKVRLIIAVTTLIISANMFFDSEQTVDYKGLDKSVITISDHLDDSGVDCVFYDDKLRFELSSLVSYSDIEFIPVDHKKINHVSQWIEDKGYENAVYMTDAELDCMHTLYNISYKKQGEEYNEIPTSVYKKSYDFYAYDMKAIADMYQNVEEELYMKGKEDGEGEIYGDGWIGRNIVIDNLNIDTDSHTLVIRRLGYDNYFFDEDRIDELKLQIIVNDKQIINEFTVDGNDILADIGDTGTIHKIEVACNTFNPGLAGENSDTRELGLDIKMIYILRED